ncbi:MAG: hypothetical protein LBI19_08860 [Oscillospiraceae bacterium]|jgi:hypothetical protein|nr:hypothetical protein [Oscillospiraceae bacterium]
MNKNIYKDMMEQAVPSLALLQTTRLKMMKEKPVMIKRSVRAAIIAIAAALLMAATALAVWRLLSPGEVAEILYGEKLREAFLSENAVAIDRSELSGDYVITLMGITLGENLDSLNKGDESKTYAVIAVSKTDGTSMPEILSSEFVPFYAIPLIKGVKPWQAGVGQTQGSTVIDGVLYLLLGCDNLEVFADKGVYLGISDWPFHSQDSFPYDEETGAFSRNESYAGVNALFELPLDVTKADPQRAAEILGGDTEPERNETPSPSDEPESSPEPVIGIGSGDEELDIEALFLLNWESPSEITMEQRMAMFDYINNLPLENFTLLEDSVKTCTVDSEGYISYEYKGEGGWSTSSKTVYSAFLASPVGELTKSGQSGGYRHVILHTYITSADGSVTFTLYEWEPSFITQD